MAALTNCPRCDSTVRHLAGITGRISSCTRCGWSLLMLAPRQDRRPLAGSVPRPLETDQLPAR